MSPQHTAAILLILTGVGLVTTFAISLVSLVYIVRWSRTLWAESIAVGFVLLICYLAVAITLALVVHVLATAP